MFSILGIGYNGQVYFNFLLIVQEEDFFLDIVFLGCQVQGVLFIVFGSYEIELFLVFREYIGRDYMI